MLRKRWWSEHIHELGDNKDETSAKSKVWDDYVISTYAGKANIVGSLVNGGRGLDNSIHMPAIDIDHRVEVVESRTPGHSHLFIDVPMTWEQYIKLLTVMVEVGIVERGYLDASIKRGMTALRLNGGKP